MTRSARRPSIPLWLGVSLAAQAVALYLPGSPQQSGLPGLDKGVHLLLFALPATLSVLAGGTVRRWVPPALVVHAVASEFIQAGFVPYRAGDPRDALADLVGVGLGCIVGARVAARRAPAAGPATASYDGPIDRG